MKIKRLVDLCAISLAVALVSCMQKSVTDKSRAVIPHIVGDGNTPVLCCWFVENNGIGGSGYAAVDGRLGAVPPAGGGLFTTVEELRLAIKKQKIQSANIEPSYSGVVPEGWKIRSLTEDELRSLLRR